jgi:Flp pilus assembly pilin Flp
MKALVARFVREDSGQDLIEYGLLVGIITSAAVVSIQQIGPIVSNYYSTLLSNLQATP